MVIIEKMAGSIVQCKKTKKSQIMIENYEMLDGRHCTAVEVTKGQFCPYVPH